MNLALIGQAVLEEKIFEKVVIYMNTRAEQKVCGISS